MANLGQAPHPMMGFSPFNEPQYVPYQSSPPGTAASSPRNTPHHGFYSPPPRVNSAQSPPRPATRAHFRTSSANVTPSHPSSGYPSPRAPTHSPRYDSEGRYATANVSDGFYSRNYPPYQTSSPQPSLHSRRPQPFSPTRNSTPSGESDEEFFGRDGNIMYATPAGRRRTDYHANGNIGNAAMYSNAGPYGSRPASAHHGGHPRRRNSFGEPAAREHSTDRYSQAGAYSPMHEMFDHHSPRYHEMPARPTTTSRRPSMTTPQRPATTAPRPQKKTAPSSPAPSSPRVATKRDAEKHKIPDGFSLKNWDPSQTPILLLGSVFDANSLGKWIYDWTSYYHGASSVEGDMAGKLWLILIQLYGKIHDGEKVLHKLPSEDRKIIFDFLEGGDRLQNNLRKLLKGCEDPMLHAAEGRSEGLGTNSGVEFVKTLFGNDRQSTDRFIQQVETFVARWSKNCDRLIERAHIRH